VYFIFLSDGGAPKRRGARSSLPPYPTLSTGLPKSQTFKLRPTAKLKHYALYKLTLYLLTCTKLLLYLMDNDSRDIPHQRALNIDDIISGWLADEICQCRRWLSTKVSHGRTASYAGGSVSAVPRQLSVTILYLQPIGRRHVLIQKQLTPATDRPVAPPTAQQYQAISLHSSTLQHFMSMNMSICSFQFRWTHYISTLRKANKIFTARRPPTVPRTWTTCFVSYGSPHNEWTHDLSLPQEADSFYHSQRFVK